MDRGGFGETQEISHSTSYFARHPRTAKSPDTPTHRHFDNPQSLPRSLSALYSIVPPAKSTASPPCNIQLCSSSSDDEGPPPIVLRLTANPESPRGSRTRDQGTSGSVDLLLQQLCCFCI